MTDTQHSTTSGLNEEDERSKNLAKTLCHFTHQFYRHDFS